MDTNIYKIVGKRTVSDVIEEIGVEATNRILVDFENANVSYPPKRMALLAFKKEKKLELWALEDNRWNFIHSYPILAASGKAGPKLQYGDKQVPEGIYRIIGLNPNSSFHLSMKINYPNEYDKRKAELEGRSNLGGNIFIHGKAASVGCIAIGDSAIEELFVMVRKVGVQNVEVIIAPNDIRVKEPIINSDMNIPWVLELYELIEKELKKFHR